MKISVFWFRRDLRLDDNTALFHSLKSKLPVLPIFILDTDIVNDLPKNDPRIQFIFQQLEKLHTTLRNWGSSLIVCKGKPIEVWEQLITQYDIEKVYYNIDYEPYANERDGTIKKLLSSKGIQTCEYKDQVIFEKNDILKTDGKPYTVFTPYKNRWLEKVKSYLPFAEQKLSSQNFFQIDNPFVSLEKFGFISSKIFVKNYNITQIQEYENTRNFPSIENGTSYLSPYLRFGVVSIRQVINQIIGNEVFLSELIWREFFMQILFHFPKVVTCNFKSQYDGIVWENNEEIFERWCKGETGYPLVDAGMRELNQTGYMHNRVRMVVASFLCKYLLIDWRWGESYFSSKLLDYELSSNNGNWQWASGTGCDATPYFRIFNPLEQQKKFDPQFLYIKKWIPDFKENYLKPIIEHPFARQRALQRYKMGILRG